jgi:putative glutamine amidotransferase
MPRPVIAITCGLDAEGLNHSTRSNYAEVLAAAGGIPVILPPFEQGPEEVQQWIVQSVDGVVFSGGPDVDPVHFGEEPVQGLRRIEPGRDLFELALARLAMAEEIPVLGVCRGIQLLNIAAGGDIYQDIPSQVSGALGHEQNAPRWYPTHAVEVIEGTTLSRITRTTRLRVNSFHHQAVRRVAPGFTASAIATDGIVEAIERDGTDFVLGIQWHPEAAARESDLASAILRAFVDAACARMRHPKR